MVRKRGPDEEFDLSKALGWKYVRCHGYTANGDYNLKITLPSLDLDLRRDGIWKIVADLVIYSREVEELLRQITLAVASYGMMAPQPIYEFNTVYALHQFIDSLTEIDSTGS